MYNKILLTACILVFALVVFAEEEPADTTVYKSIDIGEITISSTKYNSDVFQLPAAASKLPAYIIVDNKIENLTDLSGFVPNFFMPDYGSKLTSPVYIRGVGTRINSPSVGLYVDNIPYFLKAAFNFNFQDIESIDVLRGPQGTLFGRNTLAGLINITTQQPKPDRSTSVQVNYGSFNQLETQISHNQPINDKLGMIVNFGKVHNDGYFTNEFLGESADKLDSYSGRLKLNYDVCSSFNTRLTLQYENSDQAGYPYALYDIDTQSAGDVSYDFASGYERELFSAGLSMNADFGSVYLSSATSFQLLDDFQKIDQDFTPASLFMVNQNQKQNMFAQELTVSSEKGKIYEWLFGGFVFRQSLDKEVFVEYGEDGISKYRLPGSYNYTKGYDNTTSGVAFYHQSVLNIGKVNIIAGLRGDYEKATLDYQHDKEVVGNTSHVGDAELELDNVVFLPKISVKYNINENISHYATFSKGYNAGGFNSTFERDEDRSYEPEESYNYEFGWKFRCPKNNIKAGIGAYYMDWRKQQVYQPAPSGRGSMLKNAGKSESMGFELEMRYSPDNKFEAWGMFGFNKAKFVEYMRNDSTDYAGNYLPYAPRFTLNLGVKQAFEFNSELVDRMTILLQYQGFGKTYWHESNNAWQDFYGLVSGRVSFQKNDISLSIWCKNLFDADYNSFYFTALGNSYAQIGKPSRVGVTAKVRF